jgi:hypothetical protein
VSELSFPGAVMLRRIGGLLPGGRRLRLGVLLLVVIAALAPATAKALFTAPVYLSDPGRDAYEPQVAINGNGGAFAVWERFDGSYLRIQARTRTASGVLGSVQTLSASGRDAFDPQVAVTGAGKAFADWTRYESNVRIQGAAGP